MYIDLRTKLEMYKKSQQNKESQTKITGPDVHEIIKGTISNNESGSYYLIEKSYPLTHIHGGYPLGKAIGSDYSTLSKAISESEGSLGLNDMVFLDTETTGLSGGAGTVAFLIGVGFFEKDSFVLQQYFMRDYDEETPMLKALNEVFSSHKIIVTFNGKAFDWNLLKARFISNRLKISIKNPIQIDLLYPSRILWKQKLESCRLSCIEECILKLRRIDDIPGSLIPSVYFKYLDDRNATEIKKVITHNEKDILSMVSLMIKMNLLLSNPLSEAADALELLGVGKVFEKQENSTLAMQCFNKCTTSVNCYVKELSLKKLAYLHRRNKDFKKAAECLETLISFSNAPNIPAKIELAKHYEHRLSETGKALNLVLNAFETCSQAGFIRALYYDDLKVRLERLKKKAQKL
jgi:uncharacterized protein